MMGAIAKTDRWLLECLLLYGWGFQHRLMFVVDMFTSVCEIKDTNLKWMCLS